MKMLMEALKFAKGLDPIADAFAGATVNSDVVSMRGYGRALFVVHIGVGATGSSTFTVESCDDVTPTTATAIPFWSREILTGDTESAITRRAAAGFVNTVGSSKIILIEVDAADLVAGDAFVRLDAAESVNDPVLGGILVILGGEPTRYAEDVKATAIV